MFDADVEVVTDTSTTLRRDGLLAAGTLAVCLAVGTLTDSDPFLDWRAALLGVGGALAVEAVFLRYPERLLALWARPAVALAGAGAVAGLGLIALSVTPWVLGALTWGLGTYAILLVCVVLGAGNPLTALPGLSRRD